MVDASGAVDRVDVSALPYPPKNPLPYRQRLKAARLLHTGCEMFRDSGGPVTTLNLAPKWLMPQMIVATSPRACRDILGRTDEFVDKSQAHDEMRHQFGRNLFDLHHDEWLPRRRALQPVFTKRHVGAFGGHMAQAAQAAVDGWADGVEIDLDVECRKLTMRALGRSVLGLDLDDRADGITEPMHTGLTYIAGRISRPVRAPRWLPTPARHRARVASASLHRLAADILQGCRDDPTRDAPLVRALMAATDPQTGQALSDAEICDELIIFMLAGHDTTATALTYAMWALGRHPHIQDRAAAEVAALGDRELTPDDVSSLSYTVAVLREALRLCPPGAIIARTAVRDIDVAGYRVDAGSILIFGVYAVHRDPELWERALEFDPDRFSAGAAKGRDRWQYLPFGAGPRSCIGDHFAMLQATLALATVLRDVEIASVGTDFPVELPFTAVAAAPVHAIVRKRATGRETIACSGHSP